MRIHKLLNSEPGPGAAPPTDAPPTDAPPTDAPPTDAPPQPSWLESAPDDWREQLAGENESTLNVLRRVPDVGTLTKNYIEAQAKIRSGEIEALQPPDENSTEEQVAAYREAMGIPESPDAYELSLDDGLVLGAEDEAIMPAIYEAAHQFNVPANAMTALANAMLKGRELEFQKMEAKNNEDMRNATAVLRDTWRGDYDANINLINNTIIGAMPEEVREEFGQAMLPDGTKLFNSPAVMAVMADWARQLNPAATVVPSGANPVQTINDEIAALEKRMGDDDWHKDQQAQKRYVELVEARERLG